VSVPMGFDRTVSRVGCYAVVLRMRSDGDVVLPRTVEEYDVV
jgi:hypothetical protein